MRCFRLETKGDLSMRRAHQESIQGQWRMHGAMTVQPIELGPATATGLPITDADPDSDEVARLAAAGLAVAHPSAPSAAA